jgi:hypothetical protein
MAFLSPLEGARAAQVSVCAEGCDFTTVQAAIASADVLAGDAIVIQEAIHTEAGIIVDKDLIIMGLGAQDTIVQAHPQPKVATDRVFFIAHGATVIIRDMTIQHGNPASEPESGGGIHNQGTLTLENVIVRDNSGGAGGGILNDGTITLINCTVSDNEARGGGVFLNGVGEFVHSTISQNEAKTGGGVYVEGSGEVGVVVGQLSYTNTLIAGNTARMEKYGVADCMLGDYASIAVKSNNWVGDGQCEADYSGDPMLAALSEGSISERESSAPAAAAHLPQAHALLPDSPLVDILPPDACALETDQWGTPRPQGAGCEIGAYELPQQQNAGPGVAAALLMSAFLLLVMAFVSRKLAHSRAER